MSRAITGDNVRVLVTGGAGFIGSHLVDRFLQRGDRVRVVDSLEPRVHPHGRPEYLPDDVEFIPGDVRDRQVLQKALRGVDVVSHQAAYQDYMPDYATFIHVNAYSTVLMLEIIHQEHLPVRKIIVASSQAVYGEGQYECPEHGVFQPHARSQDDLDRGFWELRCPACRAPARPCLLCETFANPYNAYALSKLGEEMIALRLGRLIGVPTVALRYSITQGPRQSPHNAYSGICRIFTTRLLASEPPIIYEDGQQTRDFVHVQDVVNAHMCVLEHSAADYEAFNVGSGQPTIIAEYADLLMEAMGVRGVQPVVSGEYRVGDNRHSVSDISKLKALGWTPTRTLGDIFADYLEWIGQQKTEQHAFEEADRAMRAQGIVRRASTQGGSVL